MPTIILANKKRMSFILFLSTFYIFLLHFCLNSHFLNTFFEFPNSTFTFPNSPFIKIFPSSPTLILITEFPFTLHFPFTCLPFTQETFTHHLLHFCLNSHLLNTFFEFPNSTFTFPNSPFIKIFPSSPTLILIFEFPFLEIPFY